MAKRKAAARTRLRRAVKKRAPARPARRSRAKRPAKPQAAARKAASRQISRKKATVRAASPRKPTKVKAPTRQAAPPKPAKVAKLDRVRRTLDDAAPGVPSSLDMDQHGSAARTGYAEMAQNLREHRGMTDVAGGDVDVDIEDAYFTGEEAPGGDNPTPDQDIVDDIGKALGVEYDDNEPLKGSEKVIERDKHRWELDPASAEDFKERK
jgi:hypothetical protein